MKDQNNSNPYIKDYFNHFLEKVTTSFEPRNIVMDAKLWQFQGENPEAWIVQAEHYFNIYKIEEDQKLIVASFYLDGEALEWYQWLFRNNQLIYWPHFADKLRIRFKQKGIESAGGRFANLEQVTYVTEYQNCCEDILSFFGESDVLFPGHTYVHQQWSNITNSLLHQNYGEQSECKSNVGQVFDNLPQRVEKIIPELSLTEDDFENISQVLNKNWESEIEICGNPNLVIGDYGLPLVINNGEDSVITNRDEKNARTDEDQESTLVVMDWKADRLFVDRPQRTFKYGKFIADKVIYGTTKQTRGDNDISLTAVRIAAGDESEHATMHTALIKRGIFDHFNDLCHAALISTLLPFLHGQFTFSFPFDPGSSFLSALFGATRSRVFYNALDRLKHDNCMLFTRWNACIVPLHFQLRYITVGSKWIPTNSMGTNVLVEIVINGVHIDVDATVGWDKQGAYGEMLLELHQKDSLVADCSANKGFPLFPFGTKTNMSYFIMHQDTILVTGGADFIGTHTVMRLLNGGFKVTILDNFHNSVEEVAASVRELVGPQLPHNLEVHLSDIKNKNDLAKLFSNNLSSSVVAHFFLI